MELLLTSIDSTSARSEEWRSGRDNQARGKDWLDQIYKANRGATMQALAAHRDFSESPNPVHPSAALSTHNLSSSLPPYCPSRTIVLKHRSPRTGWLSIEITYGLYLSDHSVIGPVETELAVIAGIMMQNLKRETGWHLRGMRRIGIAFDDVERIQQCVSDSTVDDSNGCLKSIRH